MTKQNKAHDFMCSNCGNSITITGVLKIEEDKE